MAIWIEEDAKVLVQGITGKQGMFHADKMVEYGTNIVGGCTPGKGGQTVDLQGKAFPVWDSMFDAIKETDADATVIYVPPPFAGEAIMEAADAFDTIKGEGVVVCITEGIPTLDMVKAVAFVENRPGVRLIGPNCPGIISPGKSNAGIIPSDITKAGRIGLVSKSGTLTYQMMYELRDIGFSTCVGIGGDPIIGTTHIDCLAAFQEDPETDAIVMIGEIGGDAEERAAAFIKDNVTKPVVGYVAGFTAPEGKTMGHAGAIVSGSAGTAAAKQEALEAVGVKVGKTPSATAALMREIMTGK